MRALAILILLDASCGYDVTFRDCRLACATSGSACPDGFACGAEGLCRAHGAVGTCAAILDAGSDTAGDAGRGSAIPGIYVTTFGGNQVMVFALDASGSAPPQRTISGSNTQLATPVGIAIDHVGEIVVANLQGGAVTVYPGDADGDVPPSRVLADPGLTSAFSVAIAADDGVFVGAPGMSNPEIFHFPPGASTSERRFTAGPTNGDPFLALTEAGDVVVGDSAGVATFAAAASGSATPIHSFTPSVLGNARAVAVAGGAIAVTADSGQIQLFDEQTTGTSVAPMSTLAPSEIVHTISQPALAVDASSTSPVFYACEAQQSDIWVVPTSGVGASLTAGAVRTIIRADRAAADRDRGGSVIARSVW